MKDQTPVFKKAVVALIVCIITLLIYAQKGDKKKNAFQSISGVVVSVTNMHERFTGKDTTDYRYVEIDNYPQPFQVFIGKAAGDFKPLFENIDHLKPGDSLTVYYEENSKTSNSAVNNLAWFMDKGLESIFVKGNSIKNVLYWMAAFSGLIILLLIILKITKRIR